MKKILFVCSLALFYGCKSSSVQYSTHKVEAKINKVCKVVNKLTLTVNKILDSRCPEGCDCIWAGEVRVSFELNDNGTNLDTCLVLPFHPSMQFKHYKIELKNVDPYPICNYHFPNDATVQFSVCSINKEAL